MKRFSPTVFFSRKSRQWRRRLSASKLCAKCVAGKWTITSLPSGPRQRKVSWGKTLVSFQIFSLAVVKYFIPDLRNTCGRVYITPNTSGSQQVSASMSNSARRNRLPKRICRTKLSGPSRLPSGSTYIAPITSHLPSRTRWRISSKTAGYISFNFSYRYGWL